MFGLRRAFLAAAAVVSTFMVMNSAAEAVSVTTECYGSSPNFSLETDTGPGVSASACVGSGLPQNDINNGVPASFPAGYTLLDKSDGNGTDGVAGWFNAIGFTGSTSGSFTITPGTGYDLTTLILAFKDGTLPDPPGPPTDPGYGAFLLNGALEGSWAILFDHAVSHFTLYRQACPPAGCPDPGSGPGDVPLPPAIWLFASGLAGLGLIGARRRRRKPSSF